MHHGEVMRRITISLDDELYAMARGHAAATHMSVSKAINDLLRRKVGPVSREDGEQGSAARISSVTGLRVSRGEGRVTLEDVQRAVDDEDAPFLERAGKKDVGES